MLNNIFGEGYLGDDLPTALYKNFVVLLLKVVGKVLM